MPAGGPDPATNGPVVAEFRCAICGAFATRTSLFLPGDVDAADPPSHRLEGPYVATDSPAVRISTAIGPSTIAAVGAAIEARDAAALLAFDREFVPFFCGPCAASYCPDHWDRRDEFEDGFFDAAWGRCPRGHERMLWD